MKNSNVFINLICIIPVFLILGVVNLKAQGNITGYTYMGSLNGHHYFLSQCGTTWEQANEAAIEMGGYLATITSYEENSFLGYRYVYYAQIPPSEVFWGFWTGLKGEQGVYAWTNGEPVTFTLWYEGGDPEPVFPDGAPLIGDPGVSYSDYYWKSYETSGLAAYVVEFPFELSCNYPNKNYVCHNGNTICVNTASVQAHLNHGDFAGPCGPCNTYALQAFEDEISEIEGHPLQQLNNAISNSSEIQDIAHESSSSNQIQVSPNPASDEIRVILPGIKQEGIVSILSLTGQEIHTLSLHGEQSMTIDLSAYTSGLYLIDVRCSIGHFQKKFVKL